MLASLSAVSNWTLRQDPVQLRGEARHQALVQVCQHHDILAPEDECAIWAASTGPIGASCHAEKVLPT